MDKKVLMEGKKTPEGRLKIREIRKLQLKNGVLEAIRETGIITSLYIYILCFLSVFGESFGLKSNKSLLYIIFCMIDAHYSKKIFLYNISQDKQINNEIIIDLENEILNDDIERGK